MRSCSDATAKTLRELFRDGVMKVCPSAIKCGVKPEDGYMSKESRTHNSISREMMTSLARELRSRLVHVLSDWQVQEHQAVALAQSRREARIAEIRAVLISGLIQENDEFAPYDEDGDSLGWVDTRLKEAKHRRSLDLADAD
jgi:hypothetical protein